MARITIEDCLGEGLFSNHFELVNFASKRAKQLSRAAPTKLPEDEHNIKDKPAVTALREIAANVMNQTIYDEEIQRQEAAAEAEQEEFSYQALASMKWSGTRSTDLLDMDD